MPISNGTITCLKSIQNFRIVRFYSDDISFGYGGEAMSSFSGVEAEAKAVYSALLNDQSTSDIKSADFGYDELSGFLQSLITHKIYCLQ